MDGIIPWPQVRVLAGPPSLHIFHSVMSLRPGDCPLPIVPWSRVKHRTPHRIHIVMSLRPRDRNPLVCVVAGRINILHHAKGLPVLRAFPLCTCCRHYPGTVTGDTALLITPALSVFPAWVGGSTCATSFSRIAQRSLTLRPAHSLDHLK